MNVFSHLWFVYDVSFFGGQYPAQEWFLFLSQTKHIDSRERLVNFFPHGSPCLIFFSAVLPVQEFFFYGNYPTPQPHFLKKKNNGPSLNKRLSKDCALFLHTGPKGAEELYFSVQ